MTFFWCPSIAIVHVQENYEFCQSLYASGEEYQSFRKVIVTLFNEKVLYLNKATINLTKIPVFK